MRTEGQVRMRDPYCSPEDDGSNKWSYILGCFHGFVNETVVGRYTVGCSCSSCPKLAQREPPPPPLPRHPACPRFTSPASASLPPRPQDFDLAQYRCDGETKGDPTYPATSVGFTIANSMGDCPAVLGVSSTQVKTRVETDCRF